MKKCIFLLLLGIHFNPAFAQFKYSAWNMGPQLGSFHITNGVARYVSNGPRPNDIEIADSANTNYSVTNFRFNIEEVRTNVFVKAYWSQPFGKHADHDSAGILGKNFEVNMKFGYGFKMGEHVGLQFGLNGGVFRLRQYDNLSLPIGATRFDYFVPSAGTTPLDGEHMFGDMAAWEGGVLVSNIIAFSDNLALQTTLTHNSLKNKRKTIKGSKNDLEIELYYSNPEMHNIGFKLGLTENWMHFNGYTPDDAANDQGFPREYPASKVKMITFNLGVNIPIVFTD